MISGGRLIDAVLSELIYEGLVLKIAMNLLYSDVRASARLGDGKACHKEELHNVWQLLTYIKLFKDHPLAHLLAGAVEVEPEHCLLLTLSIPGCLRLSHMPNKNVRLQFRSRNSLQALPCRC